MLASVLCLTGCVTDSVNSAHRYDAEEAARARVVLGLKHLEQGNRVQARYNLERAAEHAPKMPEVHNGLAWYYQVVEDPARADAAYRQALLLDPKNPATLNNYGGFLCQQKRYGEADEYFQQAINHPGYVRIADALENAGTCALEDNRPLAAEAYFRQSLRHDPNRSVALLGLAEIQIDHNQPATAKGYLGRYHMRYPESSRSLWLSYRVAQQQRQPQQAQDFARQLAQQFPGADETKALGVTFLQ